MYLADHEIKSLLDQLDVETDHTTAQPFNPDQQIGPCSVDLRLSGVYWKPTKHLRRRGLRLDQTRLMELDARRGWQRFEVAGADSIRLRPGEMVLARTTERFRVPHEFAGAIEGRSSFARLGLEVHLAGGFINPGWEGHMPLSLVNHGTVTLFVPVGAAVCQLMLVPLHAAPERDYGDRVDHKYQNDDGGPSYWWRDQLFSALLNHSDLDDRTLSELDEMLPKPDEGVLARLDDFLSSHSGRRFGNIHELLDGFAKTEQRLRTRNRVGHFIAEWAWTLVAALVLAAGTAWGGDQRWVWAIGVVAFLLSFLGVVWSLRSDRRDEFFLSPSELATLRANRTMTSE